MESQPRGDFPRTSQPNKEVWMQSGREQAPVPPTGGQRQHHSSWSLSPVSPTAHLPAWLCHRTTPCCGDCFQSRINKQRKSINCRMINAPLPQYFLPRRRNMTHKEISFHQNDKYLSKDMNKMLKKAVEWFYFLSVQHFLQVLGAVSPEWTQKVRLADWPWPPVWLQSKSKRPQGMGPLRHGAGVFVPLQKSHQAATPNPPT